MPIDLAAILEPISDEEPSGVDIRYDAVTKKLREARRAEEDFSQGVWKRDVKVADYTLVLKLGPEVLAKQSKDLQVAAWLTEALVRTEGLSGLRQGLELIRGLLERFWDTVYPQADEDGDLEMRAAPLRWVGSQLDNAIKSSPLLKGGVDWYQYKASRTIPAEEESTYDPTKLAQRQEAIAEGACTPEEVASKLAQTPYELLESRHSLLKELIEFIDSLSEFCDKSFDASSPALNPLKATLEEVLQTARVLMKQKGAPEPAAVLDPVPAVDPGWDQAAGYPPILDFGPPVLAPETAPQPNVRRVAAPAGAEPASVEDAVELILRAARYLRRELPHNPMPYLVVRALRWGEFRINGSYVDQSRFEAPSTEVRVELKRLANEGQWDALREAAENAAGQPCGRAWLDVQRYAVTACRNNGLEAPAMAILSGVKALLADYPDFTNWVLADDTPVANSETRQWLESEGLMTSSHPVEETPPPPSQPAWSYIPEPVQQLESNSDGIEATPDAFQLAREAAQSGRFQEAVSILSAEIAHESSARARFLRKTQLAQICLAAGQPAIGRPILQQLSHEIGDRGLEQWENGETLSQPLALLYQCMNGDETAARQELYGRICRLDPPRALGLER